MQTGEKLLRDWYEVRNIHPLSTIHFVHEIQPVTLVLYGRSVRQTSFLLVERQTKMIILIFLLTFIFQTSCQLSIISV